MFEPTQYVSGLASNIDWRTMVDQLMQIERRGVNNIETQVSELEGKKSAWQELNTKLATLKSYTNSLADADSFARFMASSRSSSDTAASELLNVSLGTASSTGSFDVEIEQIAAAEKLSSASFTDADANLGFSGSFLLNGSIIEFSSTDSLRSLRSSINDANSGSDATNVSASILTLADGSSRLVLTAEETGSSGIDLRNTGTSDVLSALGFVDGSKDIASQIGSKAYSSSFTSTSASIYSLIGYDSSFSGDVTISGTNVTLDLNDSLAEIRDDINTAVGAGTASIVQETDDDGNISYKLEIDSTSFTDDDNILEALGVLKGGHGAIAHSIEQEALYQTGDSLITSATTFADLLEATGGANAGVVNGDTITISGKDHDGNTVSGTYTIDTTDTMGDLLDYIENTVFSGNVSASVVDGKITVTDNTSGDSRMTLSLVANNEGGGSLDFGTAAVATEGRSRQIQAGQDAKIVVDGVYMEKSTNTIDDVLDGVTLNLLKAEDGTNITVNVDRNAESITGLVQSFVDNFNDVSSWMKEQTSYDTENESTGGPLFGDTTLSALQSRLLSEIISTVDGASEDLNTLASVGITLNEDGGLDFDTSTFKSKLETDFNNVVQLFSVKGQATSGDLQFLASSKNTQAGMYNVNITQAASQATTIGNDLSGGLGGDETLTITDLKSNQSAVIELLAAEMSSTDDIVNAINSELAQVYTQKLESDTAFTDTGANPVTRLTTFAALDSTGGGTNDLAAGDKIQISGTSRTGKAISYEFDIADPTTQTLGDLFDDIEDLFGNVTVAFNSSGNITITDNLSGKSQLDLSLTYDAASSGSSFTFGDIGVEYGDGQTGRYAMNISASNDGGNLVITHDDYGSENGFSIIESSDLLGLGEGVDHAGQDVQGTINGEEAIGKGQTLTGKEDEANIEDLVIKYTGAATGDIGDISITNGFGEIFDRLLYDYTDPYTGYIDAKTEGIDTSVDSMNTQIEDMERRLERKREMLVNKFLAMEKIMSEIQTQMNWMNSQLAKL